MVCCHKFSAVVYLHASSDIFSSYATRHYTVFLRQSSNHLLCPLKVSKYLRYFEIAQVLLFLSLLFCLCFFYISLYNSLLLEF